MKVLVDSNVIIAGLVERHVHHVPSNRLLGLENAWIVVATHSLTESFNHMTRPERMGIRLEPAAVAKMLATFAARTRVRALNAEETASGIATFATSGGRGARLYDFLIGYAAELEAVDVLVTWNARHFTSLFPTLRIATPEQLMES